MGSYIFLVGEGEGIFKRGWRPSSQATPFFYLQPNKNAKKGRTFERGLSPSLFLNSPLQPKITWVSYSLGLERGRGEVKQYDL
jgi:hypothetical protein